MTAKAGETLTWSTDGYLLTVAKGGESDAFQYTPDRRRFKRTSQFDGGTEVTEYMGGFVEKFTRGGVTEWRHMIRAGGEVIAQHTRSTAGTTQTRYLHRDHLGSVETITTEAGSPTYRFSYDAFGARRNATTWNGVLTWPTSDAAIRTAREVTHRGYTGHEMLDGTGLIHMNGRVYDPYLGKMLSADPTVPGAFNSQAFNRYSYVFNNPMSLVDPSGFGPFGFGGIKVTHADGGSGIDNDQISGSGRTCPSCRPTDEADQGTGSHGFSGTSFLLNGIPLRFTPLGAHLTSSSFTDDGEANGNSTFNYARAYGTVLFGSSATLRPSIVGASMHRATVMPGNSELTALRDSISQLDDPNNYDADYVAPGFVPTEGERIAGEVALGVAITVVAPEVLGMSLLESFVFGTTYGVVETVSAMDRGSMHGGIAYSSNVVGGTMQLAFHGAPFIGNSLSIGFDAWMGYVQYRCVGSGGCR